MSTVRVEDTRLIINNNNKDIGLVFRDVDGYYYWWPENMDWSGSWPSHVLRDIADLLDELNKPWDDELKEYFGDT